MRRPAMLLLDELDPENLVRPPDDTWRRGDCGWRCRRVCDVDGHAVPPSVAATVATA